MNVKRFTARTSRDALALVRQAFGDDAVVMSTRPCAEGVEVLAMAPESVMQLERVGADLERRQQAAMPAMPAPAAPQRPAAQPAAPRGGDDSPAGLVAAALRGARERIAGRADAGGRVEPSFEQRAALQAPRGQADVEQDVEALQMSTLSFQDYVRQRMLKRRQAELAAEAAEAPRPAAPTVVSPIEAARARMSQPRAEAAAPARAPRELPVLSEEVALPPSGSAAVAGAVLPQRGEQIEMMAELRSMRGLIEQRFGALAFMEKMQRHPRQAQLAQRMLDAGYSPALIRKLAGSLPEQVDEASWSAGVLERNLLTGERELPLEDQGGVYALVGATGVGKTTSTAKLAAAFATRHGAANLGLITLDAYRVAAHEQLRTYGRILGVPVHTAHDRASLEDLLELLSGKRLVLIDTAGVSQRDSRAREMLEMLSHPAISRLLVINAASQGETIEDQLAAYGAKGAKGVVLSKVDEAVKIGPALDAMIRHRLKVLAVANGQRVPEDWHRLSAASLVQRSLKSEPAPAWRVDADDVNLVFAGQPMPAGPGALHA